MRRLLHNWFINAAAAFPSRVALKTVLDRLTYADLHERAVRLAATLQRHRLVYEPRMTAVFAERSVVGYAGILGALLSGDAYVPLNPAFPVARTRRMLQQAGCRSLIVDAVAELQLDEVLHDLKERLLIVLPHREDVAPLAAAWPRHRFVGRRQLAPAAEWQVIEQSGNDIAYVLFTSGSTGVPKGVPVTHANATHLVETMATRYAIGPDDRLSQTFDTTFDLSVFDMFVAWSCGACVCVPSRKALLNPDRFIRDNALTVWFSVPSLALLMERFNVIQPGRYPSLRWSLFCGERLPAALAARWAAAAPASTLENLYGPTELTVACSAYRWDPLHSPQESVGGTVPIGYPLRGMQSRVVAEEDVVEVAPGGTGELLMTGPQLTPGYWNNPGATARAFVRLPGRPELFYRTGDRVRRPVNGGPLIFLGRVDEQVKVHGHRVELGEIELTLLQEPGVESAVAVGWPTTTAGVAGIVAFVTGNAVNEATVRASVERKLQSYAVPQSIRVLPELPQNANGKVDRQALVRMLDA